MTRSVAIDGTLVCGIGSPHGDDQAGWEAARRLAALPLAGCTVVAARTPADLLNWLGVFRRWILCDACTGSGPVGTLRCWRWPAPELDRLSFAGTHQFTLPDVLRLAEAMGELPECVELWTVEADTSVQSPAVASAVAALVDRLHLRLAPRRQESTTNA